MSLLIVFFYLLYGFFMECRTFYSEILIALQGDSIGLRQKFQKGVHFLL